MKRGPSKLKHIDLDVLSLPANRDAATKSKSKLFFTGIPCKRGHVSVRYTSINNCVECHRECARERVAALIVTPKMVLAKMLSAAKQRAKKIRRAF
jgi:hypothetical protein